MANKRLSELNELQAVDIQPDDLTLTTDLSQFESKKLRLQNLKTWVLSDTSLITASLALISITASYVDASLIGSVESSSYSLSSSWSDLSGYATYSDTSSYIDAENVYGSVPSSSYSKTASFLLMENPSVFNGSASYAQTASYVENARTGSYIWYIPGQNNGTVSFAMTCSNIGNSLSASYLNYTGVPNGTASNSISASYSLSGSYSVTSSYAKSSSFSQSGSISNSTNFLNYTYGGRNGTASYAMSCSNALAARSSSFVIYNGSNNGTVYRSITSDYAYTATTANQANFAINSESSSYSLSSSYAVSASYVTPDLNLYRMWGPFNSNDSGGSTGTSYSYIQNFIINPYTIAGTTVIIMAIADIKIPITTTDTDAATVSLYLDYIEPGNTHSYGPIDTTRPNNFINLSITGAFSLSGYSRQSMTLGNSWPLVSGSWWRLTVRTTGGAEIDTIRGVNFFIYTNSNTDVQKTAYPPF